MTSSRTVLFATLLLLAAPLAAQDSIKAQMTPQEFSAAGLDKLSADELARLDGWLNRTIGTETEKATAEAKKAVERDVRGFFDFGSTEPVVANMVGEFRGFARGREYSLDNGNVWKQVDDTSVASTRRDNPKVEIAPSLVGNAWYFRVDGLNKRAKVHRIK